MSKRVTRSTTSANIAPKDKAVPPSKEREPEEVKSVMTNASSNKMALAMKKLQEEQEILEEVVQRKAELKMQALQRKYELLEAMTDPDPDLASSEHFSRLDDRVHHWVNETGLTLLNAAEKQNEPSCEKKMSSPIAAHDQHQTINVDHKKEFEITRSQAAARKVVSVDLPKFDGSSESWPLFIATVRNTTRMCGYSDEENMVRLQKALKGKAYDAVKPMMMNPENFEEALSTLKMLFGQPERVIHQLLEKISALPKIREHRFDQIIDFAVAVKNYKATVEACGLEEYMYNVTLLHQLVLKLPPNLQSNWAEYKGSLATSNLSVFSTWLYARASALSTIVMPGPSIQPPSENARQRNSHLHTHHSNNSSVGIQAARSKFSCFLCSNQCESLAKCEKFRQLPVRERWSTVRNARVCRICLGKHKRPCVAARCGRNGCSYNHHILLHDDDFRAGLRLREGQPTSPTVVNNEMGCNNHQALTTSTIMRYVPVVLSGPRGELQTFAFLDEGSDVTLIDKEVADQLGLIGTHLPLYLRWTGDTKREELDSRVVDLVIKGLPNRKSFSLSGVRTVTHLELPQQSVDMSELSHNYGHLRGLPLMSYRNAKPPILLGICHAHLGLPLKTREGKPYHPVATKTRLGWCVGGCLGNEKNQTVYSANVHLCQDHCDEEVHNAMKRYFAIDSHGISQPGKEIMSKENERALSMLEKQTIFNGERYETGLLWRFDVNILPNNKEMAWQRHRSMQSKMNKDPLLKDMLQKKIISYIEKDYVRKLSAKEENDVKWLLPVFSVQNVNKPGKIRLVWDAAAKFKGQSLNSVLLKGPDLMCSLWGILLRFRLHPIGLTGDICEMFHQIRIREEDQLHQCFLWPGADGETVTYAMKVMTFGACCSPNTAQYVKNVNAARFKDQYPSAYNAITQSHYVDDLLVSVKTSEEAIKLATEVREIHGDGGFRIRNWLSNSKQVLKALEAEDTEKKDMSPSDDDSPQKVLGMYWNTTTDYFTYKINYNNFPQQMMKGDRRPTKRELLRVLMSIYDPIGLISHFLMYLKALLQDIWKSGVAWDDAIGDTEFENWLLWLKVLPQIESVQIPRCYSVDFPLHQADDIQLHTFVDAGATGMAAIVFLRIKMDEVVNCAIVASKTKVAPLKLVSVPRLELQAALMGTRLAKATLDELKIEVAKKVYWTDSRDVLCWLKSDHRRYSQFVGFRVTEIQESTELNEWRYVPSKMNVADDATKRKKVPDFSDCSRWFNGPPFLYEAEKEWPQYNVTKEPTEEEKLHVHTHHSVKTPIFSLHEFSSWSRLLRIVAWVKRYIDNVRRKAKKEGIRQGPLSSDELQAAEWYILRSAQQECFPAEYSILLSGKSLPKSSKLYTLIPELDDHGVMRMRTRIAACQYATEDAKRPIIMSRYHRATELIIATYHSKYHHHNHETVINEVRQRYQIFGLRACYNAVRRKCQRCKLDKTIPHPPPMADLPPCRLEAFSRPFTHTGIDFFGPIEVTFGRRCEKRWVMLATCLTVRAIHLEVVHSLSTTSCILAIRNFIARRGQPRTFYSDRGTNFVGAKRELESIKAKIDSDIIMREFTTNDTEWVLNPPLSPHMGGSWERQVRTVKKNLLAVTSLKKLSDETLLNFLIEVEQTVNAHPLTHVPVDDDSAPALTPNHFLLGSSNGIKPLSRLNETGSALKQNWQTTQILANLFWKRWVSDYLPEITRRSKWFQEVKPIEVGDIVLIVDDKLPRNCWPKGRVVDTTPGRDGRVRSATVQTARGVYVRPAAKIAVLDILRESE